MSYSERVKLAGKVLLAIGLVSAYARAQTVEQARAAIDKQDYPAALAILRPLAEQGNAEALYTLGFMYWDGRQGVPPGEGYTDAFNWFPSSPPRGSAQAQYRVGQMYSIAQGTRLDYVEAVSWYRKAADQGMPLAQFNLGTMYVFGRGVAQSYTEATNWFRKAAEQGFAGAQLNLGIAYREGQGVAQDSAQNTTWFLKAAEQGTAEAQFSVGFSYSNT